VKYEADMQKYKAKARSDAEKIEELKADNEDKEAQIEAAS